MSSSQQRAMQNYRDRLAGKGLMRFEVLGRRTDRELIRSLARKLAEDSPQAQAVRLALVASVRGGESSHGKILSDLRASALVGADLDVKRPREFGRTVDL